MNNIKIETNLQNNTRCKVFLIEGHMGDFYISQNIDLLKDNAFDPDIFVDVLDNYEDVQLGVSFTEQLLITVKYPMGHRVEPVLDAFENALETMEGKPVTIYSFNSSSDVTVSNIKKLILSYASVIGRFDQTNIDQFLDLVRSTLFSIIKIYPDDGIEQIVTALRKDMASLTSVLESLTSDNTEVKVESYIDPNSEKNDLSLSTKGKINQTEVLTVLISKLIERLNITEPETIEEKITSFVNSLPMVKEVIIEEDNEEEEVKDEEEVEVKEEIEIVPDEDTDEDAPEEYSVEAIREEFESKNKMPSERALELVKFLNSKWLTEIAPNVNHKIGNILFFKENMDKFKLNSKDDLSDQVSMVVGGVVHLELLFKNLTEWSNPDANWKIDTKRAIKKNQKKWRKEFKKFKNSVADSILPFIKNILHKDEEIEVVEDNDSIDLCIYKTTPEVIEEKPVEAVEENTSVESLETNIYNTTVSLESLRSESNSEEEYFEKLLLNEIPNKDSVIKKGLSFNLFTNEPLPITERIKRRVKVQAIKNK